MGKIKPNAKIKNATKVEYKGIRFDSKLELFAYKELEKSGLWFTYQYKFTLQPSFKLDKSDIEYIDFKSKKVNTIREITWTIDFIIYGEKHLYYLETKGFRTNEFKLKFKIFLFNHIEQNSKVFLVSNQKNILKTIEKIKEYER